MEKKIPEPSLEASSVADTDAVEQLRREEALNKIVHMGRENDGQPNLEVFADALSLALQVDTVLVVLGDSEKAATVMIRLEDGQTDESHFASVSCQAPAEVFLGDVVQRNEGLATIFDLPALGLVDRKTYIGIALKLGERILGHVAMFDRQDSMELSERAKRLVLLLTRRLAADLQLDRAIESSWQREQYLAALVAVQRKLMSSDDPRDMYEAIMGRLGTISDACRVYLVERTDRDGAVWLYRTAEWKKPKAPERTTPTSYSVLPRSGFLADWWQTLKTGQPVFTLTESAPNDAQPFMLADQIKATLLLPVLVRDDLYGFIGFDNCITPTSWSGVQVDLLRSAATSLAFAMHNSETARQLNWLINRSKLLDRITFELRQQRDVEDLCNTTVDLIGETFNCDRVSIHGYEAFPPTMPCVAEHLKDPSRASLAGGRFLVAGNPIAAQVIESEQAVVIHDLLEQSTSREVKALARLYGRSLMAVRTTYHGHMNGLIAVFANHKSHTWSSGEVELLEAVGRQVGLALGQASFIEELKETAQSSEGDLDIFDDTAMKIGKMFGADRCTISEYVAEGEQRFISPISEYLAGDFSSLLGQKIPLLDTPLTRRFLKDEQAWAWSDLSEDPEMASYREYWESNGIRSILIVPTFLNGRPNGQVALHQCTRVREWTDEDKELMGSVASQVAMILDQGRSLRNERQRRKELASKNMELEDARRTAEVASRAKGEFLAHMSHELRTPLSSILGYAQLLERDTDSSERQREILHIINQSGEHLLELINNVLEMSRIESGNINLEFSEVNIANLFQSMQDMFSLRARSRNLSLTLQVSPDIPSRIMMDKGKLRQIVINLVNNAIKFTEQGGIDILVTVVDQALQVTVADTGTGIDQADLEDVFTPFVKTSDSEVEGTGLGLSISRRFIEALGGELEVDSRLGVGSSFQFRVPYDPVAELRPTPQFATDTARLADGSTVPKILIIDDHELNRTLLRRLLEDVGFNQIVEAEDGRSAFLRWKEFQPDLCFVDLRLPDMSGIDVIRAIRSQAGADHPILIALSANVLEYKSGELQAVGCQSFIAKPFEFSELMDCLSEFLNVEFVSQTRGQVDGPVVVDRVFTSDDLTSASVHTLDLLESAARSLDAEGVRDVFLGALMYNVVPPSVESMLEEFRFDLLWSIVDDARKTRSPSS